MSGLDGWSRRTRNLRRRKAAASGFATLVISLACTLGSALAQAQDRGAAAPKSDAEGDAIEEISVVGERPGPSLWRVTNGDHVLWILGTLDPLPKDMTWRSHEVESVLREVQVVLPNEPAVSVHAGPITYVQMFFQLRRVRKIPGDHTLKDWLPPELYARWAALKMRYHVSGGGIDKETPVLAGLDLYVRALDVSKLLRGPAIENSVLKMARKDKVQIQQVRLTVDDPRGVISEWGAMSQEAQVSCLEALVGRLETDLDTIRAQARAWALGDVATLRKLPYPKEIQACDAAFGMTGHMRQLIDAVRSQQNAALEGALTQGHTTLAIRPIYDLLGSNGTLAKLKSAGYAVEGP
jgi:hypothetical protein